MGVHLRVARVFDGEGFVEVDGVTLEGERIVGIGAAPVGVAVVELGDVTLLPGLVDAHVHLVFDGDGTLEEQVADQTDDQLRERARGHARTMLAAGITTVRDLGDRGWVTLDLRGEPDLPRILAAGPPITAVNGHCWYLGSETEDGGLVAAVRERHERGADVVKLMATGGISTPTHPVWAAQFDHHEVIEAVAEARRLGLPVAAHAHGIEGMRQVMEAGVSTIEHGSWVHEPADARIDEDLARDLVHAGIPISATFGMLPHVAIDEGLQQLMAATLENQRRFVELGGALVVGTDCGIEPSKPHDVLPWSLFHLAEVGITGAAALATLTSRAADACGVGDEAGRVRVGAPADLLAVRGDPSVDAAALRAVVGVWRLGRRVVG